MRETTPLDEYRIDYTEEDPDYCAPYRDEPMDSVEYGASLTPWIEQPAPNAEPDTGFYGCDPPAWTRGETEERAFDPDHELRNAETARILVDFLVREGDLTTIAEALEAAGE